MKKPAVNILLDTLIALELDIPCDYLWDKVDWCERKCVHSCTRKCWKKYARLRAKESEDI